MSKRKRSEEAEEEEEEEDATANAVDYRQQRRIVSAVMQSTKELAKAFKTARGFERQKLGRRKKIAVAEKDDKDIKRIDSEIAALKALDMASCAQHHLQKSLLKIKLVATSTQLPAELSKMTPLSTDLATLNVNARLCNSNPVKQVFSKLFSDVKKEFGIEDGATIVSKKRRRDAKDSGRDIPRDAISDTAEYAEELQPRKNAVYHHDVADSDGSDSDGGLDLYDERLASSEDEASDLNLDHGSDIEDLEKQLEQEGISRIAPDSKPKAYGHTADLSLSESDPEDESDNEPKKAAVPKSSFIPSLTTGYISGSGSDLDDDRDVAPKKNRRGQRARQQIWEKKYGKAAKHLQNQERGAGWDPKRGAVHSIGKPSKNGQRTNRFAKGANMEELGKGRQARAIAVKKSPRKDDSGPLHPSWVAAKLAKEKKSAPVAFQGKKISFD